MAVERGRAAPGARFAAVGPRLRLAMQKPRLDLDNYLPYLLNRVGFAMVESFTAKALKANSLSIDMWRVLAALSNADELRQVDLSMKTTIDVSTMSRIIGRMVHKGLVTRSRSKTSNREVIVALSPKGSGLVSRLIPVGLALEQAALDGLPAKDVAALKRNLRQVFENLAKAQPSSR